MNCDEWHEACLWCGNQIIGRSNLVRYCSRSHQQMAWAKRNPTYLVRQSRKRNRGIILGTNLRFIQAAQILAKDKDILTS